MMHGLPNGVFLDDKRFWPIYERAEKLDVPIYFHPATAGPRVMATSTTTTMPRTFRWWCARPGATRSRPRPPRSAWCCPACSRSIPKLKVILGHLGETLPFLVWRVDHAIARPGAAKQISFRDIFCNNFWITTSGNFSNPALMCCVQEMGVDRILFAVDWPFVVNPPGVEVDEDRAAVRRGQGEDIERQRQAAAADVKRCSRMRPWRCRLLYSAAPRTRGSGL